MNKEKINSLKSVMRKVMDGFNLKFKSKCGKCGYVQERDLFDYYASIIVLCSNCGKKGGFDENTNRQLFDDLLGDMPDYKRKFIDGYFKVVTQLTIDGVDFSQDIREEQEEYFDYSWDFAGGVLDTYISFEMFLYQLTFKRIQEFIISGKKLKRDDVRFNDYPNIQNLVDLINSNDQIEIELILEGISQSFNVKDCTKLLKIISPKDVKNFDGCYNLQTKRNDIVHRGRQANFEDYAEAFITIGEILNTYKVD